MRTLIALAGLSLIASSAMAQTADLNRLRLENLQQQNMRAQEQSNVLRRDDADVQRVAAEQLRRQTQANLRAAQGAGSPVYSAPAPASNQIPADDDALRRLQDKTLQDSNAKLRAITPAS